MSFTQRESGMASASRSSYYQDVNHTQQQREQQQRETCFPFFFSRSSILRILQTVGLGETEIENLDQEEDGEWQKMKMVKRVHCLPQWSLLSQGGLMAALQVMLRIFTLVSQPHTSFLVATH